jgi:hypothetical protein
MRHAGAPGPGRLPSRVLAINSTWSLHADVEPC